MPRRPRHSRRSRRYLLQRYLLSVCVSNGWQRWCCLRQAKAVSIEGHPNPACNGAYTHDSTHEGWPVLKNANGRYCYRHVSADKWRLRRTFTPDEDTCTASVMAKEGPLPVGAHSWQLSPTALGKPKGSGWEGRTMTVTLQ